jgi:ketosteroid isomerase-like protein
LLKKLFIFKIKSIMTKTIMLFFAGTILLAACNNAATTAANNASENSQTVFNLDTARKAVDESNRRFEAAVRAADSTALAASYSSDAAVMPSNSPAIPGSGIAAFWGAVLHMGVKDAKLSTTDLQGNQDWLIETGNYELFAEGNKSIDKGKYVVAWKNENGQWKMYRDIWNTDMPAAK